MDEAIVRWFLTQNPGPVWSDLGLPVKDYAQFLFAPRKWAKDYAARLQVTGPRAT